MSPDDPAAAVVVLMPTWGEAAFIARAIASVQAQTWQNWRLLVLDDASPDSTGAVVAPFLSDARVLYRRLPRNLGLGAALNAGLDASHAPLVAYLPADDLYYPEHLARLIAVLRAHQGAPPARLAYAGLRHDYNRASLGILPGHGLQLVQCLHQRAALRWIERAELVSDDLERLYWARLASPAERVATGTVTCEWVAHPDKRHHILREPAGGLNTYRARYRVRAPLRFHTTTGNPIDEVRLYRRQRERPATPRAPDGLRIVLVGELAYNADRVLALEEAGHELYGLWLPRPYWYNTVGPLPFGHVTDLDPDDWRAQLRRLQPDLLLVLLNWQAVPFVHAVRAACPELPFVWHFKEGPFICLEKGSWGQLVDLYRNAAGLIHVSPEVRDWLATTVPDAIGRRPELILDGDLPKRDWFDGAFTQRLSETDGALHTVVPGRPIGLHPETVAELAAENVHLHFYGDFTHAQWRAWIDRSRALAPAHLHLHDHVDCDRWVGELSRYDAGWLHVFTSANHGEMRRADWDDLNLPARLATLAAAGLPMLLRDNPGHRVAIQSLLRARDEGLFFTSSADAAAQLRDHARLATVRDRVRARRFDYCFDDHVPRLVGFLREVLAHHGG